MKNWAKKVKAPQTRQLPFCNGCSLFGNKLISIVYKYCSRTLLFENRSTASIEADITEITASQQLSHSTARRRTSVCIPSIDWNNQVETTTEIISSYWNKSVSFCWSTHTTETNQYRFAGADRIWLIFEISKMRLLLLLPLLLSRGVAPGFYPQESDCTVFPRSSDISSYW